MLNLCSGNNNIDHDEIAHEGYSCPICDIISEIKSEHEEQIEELKEEVEDLNSKILEINNQLEEKSNE